MAEQIDLAELARYVRYLQRQLVTEGTELWFQHERVREAVIARGTAIGASLPADSRDEVVAHYIRFMSEYEPSSAYDSASAAAIFDPLMDEVVNAATRAGFRTRRTITLVSSSAIEATPYTRSTDGAHIILVGPATFMFCNYWAKVFVSLFSGRRVKRDTRGSARLTVESIADAARLAYYYAATGTVIGFGILDSEPRLMPLRMEYVRAMELFVLGHEYGHCVADDASEQYRGALSQDTQHELELVCDRIGTAVSRGASIESWPGFCGAGAVLMLCAHEICRTAQQRFGSNFADAAHTHPAMDERIAVVRDQVVATSPDDQAEGATAFIDDMIVICKELASAVDEISIAVLDLSVPGRSP